MEQQKNFSKKATKRKRAPLSKHHHMTIRWTNLSEMPAMNWQLMQSLKGASSDRWTDRDLDARLWNWSLAR